MLNVLDAQGWLASRGYMSEVVQGAIIVWPAALKKKNIAIVYKRLGRFAVRNSKVSMADVKRWIERN